MVLRGQLCGRVGRCRIKNKKPGVQLRVFYFPLSQILNFQSAISYCSGGVLTADVKARIFPCRNPPPPHPSLPSPSRGGGPLWRAGVGILRPPTPENYPFLLAPPGPPDGLV